MTRKHNPRMKGTRHVPEGAVGLLKARTSKGPWYTVNTHNGFVRKHALVPAKWYFPFTADTNYSKLGYCFLNYFHALAYSLKRKQAAK
jgi:hypothetical protein